MSKKSKEILSQHNISITNPRILVINEVLKSSNPVSIEDLQSNLKGEVALSTLYRVLNDLKKINILNEFSTPEGTTLVELILKDTNHHHHLFCSDCGDVIDIELSSKFETLLQKEINNLELNFKFSVDDHGLELFGSCSSCNKSKK